MSPRVPGIARTYRRTMQRAPRGTMPRVSRIGLWCLSSSVRFPQVGFAIRARSIHPLPFVRRRPCCCQAERRTAKAPKPGRYQLSVSLVPQRRPGPGPTNHRWRGNLSNDIATGPRPSPENWISIRPSAPRPAGHPAARDPAVPAYPVHGRAVACGPRPGARRSALRPARRDRRPAVPPGSRCRCPG